MESQLITRATGLYETFCLRTKIGYDEMLSRLRSQNRQYRDADDFECWIAILNGSLGAIGPTPGPSMYNTVTKGLLEDTEGELLCGTAPVGIDGQLRYLAVGTNGTPKSYDDSDLYREIFRAVPLTVKNIGPRQVFILPLGWDDANPNVETSVSAGSWSLTSFGVASTTGLNAGDMIEVGTSPAKSVVRIQTVGSGMITTDSDTPLSSVPSNGQTVTLWIGEVGGYGNADAAITLGSGTLFSRVSGQLLAFPKNESLTQFIKFTHIKLAVG